MQQMMVLCISGYDPALAEVSCVSGRSPSEQWLLLVDQSDFSPRRAVIIKNKQSDLFLAVQDGGFTALEAYNDDCKWFLG